MNHSTLLLRQFGFSIMAAIMAININACSDSNEPETEEPAYKLILQLPKTSIESALTNIGQSNLIPLVHYGIEVYTYKYNVEYKGKTITASGLISVPMGQSGKSFPILSFQHGTMVQKIEAPSVMPLLPINQSIIAIASMGYVVSYPDLIGFGSSESHFHPYLVKEANVSAAMAMLTALKTLSNGALSGVSINDSLFMAGYSQGGWITLGMLESLESGNQNWNNIATVCGAGPYKPKLLMEYLVNSETFEQPYYLPYVLMGYLDAELLSEPLSGFFNEPYASKIPDLFNGQNSGAQINAQLTKTMADLLTDNFRNNYLLFTDVNTVLEENGIVAWNCKSPLRLVHGGSDLYVPSFETDSIFSEFEKFNTQFVEKSIYSGLDHTTAAMPAIADALIWFNEFRK